MDACAVRHEFISRANTAAEQFCAHGLTFSQGRHMDCLEISVQSPHHGCMTVWAAANLLWI
eukprot:365171-Chlamydomonas_euryale.AAC.14